MRLSWPSSRDNRRILTDREDEESPGAMVETPVLYDMPSSPGSMSTTNDAATLIASPDQTARRTHYRADQLDAISAVTDDEDDDDDEFEQRRQLLTDVMIIILHLELIALSWSLCWSIVRQLSLKDDQQYEQ